MKRIGKRLVVRSVLGVALCVALPGLSEAQTGSPRADVDVTPDIQGDINTAVSNVGKQTLADVLPEPWKSWNGARRWLAERGLTFAATYQNDSMTALSGGAKRDSTYYGRLLGSIEWDPEYATGWKGATFHFSFWQMHGVGISSHFVRSMSALSDLEGVATTRLSDIWLEQKFGDLLAVRAGKISADTEFFQTPFYGLGIGGAFGWAAILGANLPNGGIAFPFASPGVRVKLTPHPQWTFLAAVFDGDPVGPGEGNPQTRNRYGANFRLRDPAFAMAEAQWNYSTAWPGTLRIGAWKHFGRFADQRFAADGRLLSDPAGVGSPLMHRGDGGVYGVLDQQIYQIDGKPTAGAFVFSRIAAAPSDRNLIDFLVDGGISFQGVVPGRPNDQFGFLGSFARVSRQARLADLDANRFNGAYAPLRNYEAILQATYAYNVADGFVLQPHVQYVLHPGAGVVDPMDPLAVRAIRDAFVAGLRMTFNY